jgi:orotidine-5'-phosphate decarboxylase
LLAEMSSAGNLATGAYTSAALDMARRHRGFVVGFIAMGRLQGLEEGEDFIAMTPGIGLEVSGDALGQQYRSPREAVLGGSDVIIVGRGIYGKGKDVAVEAQRYREAGWNAYLERLASL